MDRGLDYCFFLTAVFPVALALAFRYVLPHPTPFSDSTYPAIIFTPPLNDTTSQGPLMPISGIIYLRSHFSHTSQGKSTLFQTTTPCTSP